MEATEEAKLLEALRTPSEREGAFRRMVVLTQERLYAHLRRMVTDHATTDDLMQQTYIKAWQNIDKFRGDSQLYTWLYRIATNEALAHFRKQKRRAETELDPTYHAQQRTNAATESLDPEAIEAHLAAALATLPERQRAVFSLKYFEQKPYKEIAKILDVSEGALKASYHHAVKKIEAYVNNEAFS